MKLAAYIRKELKLIPNGKTFGYSDLSIPKKDYSTAAKNIERLIRSGLIKRVSKGVFYKPVKSIFGELEPEISEILRPYLFENG